MTPNQITTLIASNLGMQLDMPFKLQLMERVKYWRSRMIANSLQKDPSQRKFFRQSLIMKMSTEIQLKCAAWVSCKVATTVEPIPRLVRVGNMYDYVGSPDGQRSWQQVGPGMAEYLNTGKFAHMFTQYDTINEHIQTPKWDQPLVRVDGIFDDPMLVLEVGCRCGETPVDCDAWNAEFPMSGDITQLVVQSILQVDYNRKPAGEPAEVQVNQTAE